MAISAITKFEIRNMVKLVETCKNSKIKNCTYEYLCNWLEERDSKVKIEKSYQMSTYFLTITYMNETIQFEGKDFEKLCTRIFLTYVYGQFLSHAVGGEGTSYKLVVLHNKFVQAFGPMHTFTSHNILRYIRNQISEILGGNCRVLVIRPNGTFFE